MIPTFPETADESGSPLTKESAAAELLTGAAYSQGSVCGGRSPRAEDGAHTRVGMHTNSCRNNPCTFPEKVGEESSTSSSLLKSSQIPNSWPDYILLCPVHQFTWNDR